MVLGCGGRIQLPPQGGTVFVLFGGDVVENRNWGANIRRHHFAAQAAPGKQEVARLAAEEGDGELGPCRHATVIAAVAPQDMAAVAVNSARHIHGDHRQMTPLQLFHGPRRCPLQGPRQPRPEQSVHHQFPALWRVFKEGFAKAAHHSLPAPGICGGIALEFLFLPQQDQPHGPALGLEQARRHESVAAIIARPAQDQYRYFAPALDDFTDNGGACRLHQFQARYPGFDSQRIGPVHLVHREQNRLARRVPGGDVLVGRHRSLEHLFFPRAESKPDLAHPQCLGDGAQVITPRLVDAPDQIFVDAFLGDTALPGQFGPRPSPFAENLQGPFMPCGGKLVLGHDRGAPS